MIKFETIFLLVSGLPYKELKIYYLVLTSKKVGKDKTDQQLFLDLSEK